MLLATPSRLSPLIHKLNRSSTLQPVECDALLFLPHRIVSYAPDDYVVREGQASSQCGLLLSGVTYAVRAVASGVRRILSVQIKGDFVDLQTSFLEQADHSVQALTHAEVALIPVSALLAAAGQHPDIARGLCREALIEVSIHRQWLRSSSQHNARQRIAHLICEIASRQQAAGICQGPVYGWPFSPEKVGEATGLTTLHANRAIEGLHADRLITLTRTALTIEDPERLQAVCDFDADYLHLTKSPLSQVPLSRAHSPARAIAQEPKVYIIHAPSR